MFDRELIKKVCDLTSTKEDVYRDQTTIKYDNDNPFIKYYNPSIITSAIEKYINKEWDDITLSHWACIYLWVLCGGKGDNENEMLTSFEKYYRDFITWYLDSLAFFDEEYYEDFDINDTLKLYYDCAHIWQTREEWKAVYYIIEDSYRDCDEQFVVLINEQRREYMIMYSDYIKNGFEDDCFSLVSKEEHYKLVEKLKNEGYLLLSNGEDCYYDDYLGEEE